MSTFAGRRLIRDHDGIYDVLVELCGAPEGQDRRTDFARHWPECVEYRFMGNLGFGGKVYWTGGRLYVDCYREDYTPARHDVIEAANAALQRFVVQEEQR